MSDPRIHFHIVLMFLLILLIILFTRLVSSFGGNL